MKNDKKTTASQNNPNKHGKEAPRELPAAPLPSGDADRAEGGKESLEPWWRHGRTWRNILEVIGVAAGIGYAIVTFLQWRDLRRNFEVDQRAWVSIINLHLTKEPNPGQDMLITLALFNSGKTPATDVNLKYVINIGPTEPGAPIWSRVARGNEEFIFPNTYLRDLRATAAGNSITQPIINPYHARTSRIYIRLHVDYMDIFGRHHWSEICSSHLFGDNTDRFEGCTVGATLDSSVPARRYGSENQTNE